MRGSKFGDGKEDYQIAFYLNDYDRKIGYAILPLSHDPKEDIKKDWIAPNQDLKIYVRFIDIDEILDLIYSQDDQSKQISEKLEEMIPIELEVI